MILRIIIGTTWRSRLLGLPSNSSSELPQGREHQIPMKLLTAGAHLDSEIERPTLLRRLIYHLSRVNTVVRNSLLIEQYLGPSTPYLSMISIPILAPTIPSLIPPFSLPIVIQTEYLTPRGSPRPRCCPLTHRYLLGHPSVAGILLPRAAGIARGAAWTLRLDPA